jgi:leader peptidase (prepilin peptidase)/N-methyltransferase
MLKGVHLVAGSVERHSIQSVGSRGQTVAAIAGVSFAFLILPWRDAGFAAAWWFLALIIIHTDTRFYLIPNWASAAIAGLGLSRCAMIVTPAGANFETIAFAVAAAAANGVFAFTMLWAIAAVYRSLAKRDGLGFGDVKLAGASAVWLDTAEFAACLQLAVAAALLLVLRDGRKRKGSTQAELEQTSDSLELIPFGAFLAPSAWFVYVVRLAWPTLPGPDSP